MSDLSILLLACGIAVSACFVVVVYLYIIQRRELFAALEVERGLQQIIWEEEAVTEKAAAVVEAARAVVSSYSDWPKEAYPSDVDALNDAIAEYDQVAG